MQWFKNCWRIREQFCWVIFKPNKSLPWFYICWLFHFHDSSSPFLFVLSHHLKLGDPNNVLLPAVIAFLLNWNAAQSSWLFLVSHEDCYHGLYMLPSLYCHKTNTKWSLAISATPGSSETCSICHFWYSSGTVLIPNGVLNHLDIPQRNQNVVK